MQRSVVSVVTALAALISAVAAAFWGHGLASAKDEIIRAKEAEIEALRTAKEQIAKIKEAQIETLRREIDMYRELTPNKIREYFVTVKQQLEEYNELLKSRLQEAHQVIDSKEEQLAQLKAVQELQLTSIEAEITSGVTVTLEGWARVVEIRAGEAEGHTQRVTEMTMRLANAMEVPSDQLVHFKRGALLHDIGKIAIPDRILHKTGPLTQEELELLRQHPTYAFELLSPIEYLRPALDIPYCHHEKWDGTGYPRGLKGNEIPIAARIFAVVDVWEALQTDRPYRSSYPLEKILEYMREQSGKSFDPKVVEIFTKLLLRQSDK